MDLGYVDLGRLRGGEEERGHILQSRGDNDSLAETLDLAPQLRHEIRRRGLAKIVERWLVDGWWR